MAFSMTFKDVIADDNKNIFLNMDEFAETHSIDGKEMPCIIDNNEMLEREKRYRNSKTFAEGIYVKSLLIYVNAVDFGAMPAVGRALTFDQKRYIVTDAVNEDGIYSISLEANKT
jgi:hypothetical protein